MSPLTGDLQTDSTSPFNSESRRQLRREGRGGSLTLEGTVRPCFSSSSSYTQLMARPQFLPHRIYPRSRSCLQGLDQKILLLAINWKTLCTTNKCFKTKSKHGSGFTFHYFAAHRTSYNFPTPGRKGHKSPLSLVPLWPLLIMGADLSSFGETSSDQDFTSTYFLFFAAFVEKVFFSFQSVEISKRERHFITSDLRVPEPCPESWARHSQGDCDSKSFTPGCNQGQDEP